MLALALVMVVAANGDESLGVQALMELAENQAAQKAPKQGDAVPTGLLLAAMAQAEALIEKEGVPLDGAAQEDLRFRLVKRLEAELQRIPAEPGLARRNAWERLTREVTTPWLAQQVIDAWLALPPLDLPHERVAGTWTQASQLEGAGSFALVGVEVADEVGSEGLVNGLIDPGEWVQLEVTFSNATTLPWFSTSATAKASGCLWVDERASALVGEMSPGAKAGVRLWVYVPERCTGPSTLQLALADTHRGTSAGAFSVALTPTTFARPSATQLRLDTDALGSSDGSRLAEVRPDHRLELVADVRAPGPAVISVESRWSVPRYFSGLFKSLTFRSAPAVPRGGGLFAAGDDLDGETVDADTWAAVARGPAAKRWLVKPASGRLWLAMDTTVVLSPTPPRSSSAAAALPAPLPKGAKGPAPAVVKPPLLPPPGAQTVAGLVKDFVTMVPHEVAKNDATAITAVSGYELLFDRAGFVKAYEGLFAQPQQPEAPVVPSVLGVVRSYLAVPALAVDEEAPAPEPVVLRAPPPAPPLPQPAPAAKPTLVQLDIGAGITAYGTSGTQTRPDLWAGRELNAFPTFGAKAFIGPSFVGVVGVNYAVYAWTAGPVFHEINGELGAGYSFRWTDFALTPYATLLMRYREYLPLTDGSFAVGGLLGLNARLKLSSAFGLSLDLGVPLIVGAPIGLAAPGQSVYVITGPGFRATAGLSFAF